MQTSSRRRGRSAPRKHKRRAATQHKRRSGKRHTKRQNRTIAGKPGGTGTLNAGQTPDQPGGTGTLKAGETPDQVSTASVAALSASAAAGDTALPQFFSPTSIWNSPVPADAPLDPNSAAIAGNLVAQASIEGMGIATETFGVPIYVASADQPALYVKLDQGPAQAVLQAAFAAVPLPPGAQTAAGTDANLVVYQPSTDTMWEFWRLSQQNGQWQAEWGGRMVDVSHSPGYYQNMVSPSGSVLEQANWGAPATSLALVGGVITISELEGGQINHALALGITHTAAGYWAAPAQRTDGDSTDPTAVPEGAQFRLNPNIDLGALHLPHFTLMLAEAAQKYGIIINNRSSGFTFRAQDPTQFIDEYGYNPYMGPDNDPGTPGALFDQWPSTIMRDFPWSDLQLLQMNIQTQPSTTTVLGP